MSLILSKSYSYELFFELLKNPMEIIFVEVTLFNECAINANFGGYVSIFIYR
nr:MAG TPA: hypothetical protein [Caudoviricetes sp.]